MVKRSFVPNLEMHVVIVLSDNKNRGGWPLAVIEQTCPGKDGVARAVRLTPKSGTLERQVAALISHGIEW